MHFDPYESNKSKKTRIISNICLTLIISLFIVSILYLIFRETNIYTDPHYFNTIKVSSKQLSKDNSSSFKELKNSFKNENRRLMESNFEEKYPQAYKLIKLDSSLYDKDCVYSEVNKNQVVISQCFPSDVDWRDLEVIILDVENEKNEININRITMYKIKYNARTGDLVYEDYLPEAFNLTFTSIGIYVDRSSIKGAEYSLIYKNGLTDEIINENYLYNVVYDPDKHSYHQPKYSILSNWTEVYSKIPDKQIDKNLKEFCLEIKLERDYMNYFGKCNFTYDCEEIKEFNIVINRT